MVKGSAGAVRLGLVGAGRWGRNYIRTIAGMAGVELIASTGSSPAAAELLDPGCALVTGWEALLEIPDLDGVIIATPARTHHQIARAALERGLPVLLEKPMATDPTQARSLARAALAADLPLVVDHVYLFHPAFRALVAAVGSSPIHALEGVAGNSGPQRADVSVLWDWGPHDVAMAIALMGGPPLTCSTAEEGGAVLVSLRFRGPVTARIRLSNSLPERMRTFRVQTERELIVFEDAPEARVFAVEGSGSERPIPFVPEPPLSVAVREFAEAVRRGGADAGSIRQAVEVVEVLAGCGAGAVDL